jgi:purine-cytosine permease-like protein
MSAEPPNDKQVDQELRDLWQTQKAEERKMSLEEIRNKALNFEKTIRRRNLLEYAAAAIVLVSFGIQIFQPTPPNFMTRIAAALTVMGTIYVVYMLHTRGSAKNIPDALARASFIDFYRSSLESQRDLLRDVWRWYLLPFVPGMAAMLVSFGIRDGLWLTPTPSPNQLRDGFFLLVFAAVMVVLYLVLAAVNKRSARKLQAEIDALEHQ